MASLTVEEQMRLASVAQTGAASLLASGPPAALPAPPAAGAEFAGTLFPRTKEPMLVRGAAPGYRLAVRAESSHAANVPGAVPLEDRLAELGGPYLLYVLQTKEGAGRVRAKALACASGSGQC